MTYQKKSPDRKLGRPVTVGPVKHSFYSSKQMAAQLKQACIKSGMVKAEFCRQAVEEKLNRKPKCAESSK